MILEIVWLDYWNLFPNFLFYIHYIMVNKTYEELMYEAYLFTQKMGLDMSDVRLTSVSINSSLISDTLSEYIDNHCFTLDKLCLNCFNACIDIQVFFKSVRGIDTIVTSGNLYEGNSVCFFQSKEEICAMLGNSSAQCKFHTWLTIGDYILDPTIMLTFYYRDKQNGIYRYTQKDYASVIFQKSEGNLHSHLKYEPLFLGKTYFLATRFMPFL